MGERKRLPNDRKSITHRFTVDGAKGLLTVGLYEDGRPGELFIRISNQGPTVEGLMDGMALLVSMALQRGASIEDMARKFKSGRFEPCGLTGNKKIPQATSLLDYIFRWMEMRFEVQSKG